MASITSMCTYTNIMMLSMFAIRICADEHENAVARCFHNDWCSLAECAAQLRA